MGFAEGYLQKHTDGKRRIQEDSEPGLKIIVTIPCCNEPGLPATLDALSHCDTHDLTAEVIIFINASEDAPEAVLRQNQETLVQVNAWIERHRNDPLKIHVFSDNELPPKHSGAGLARKILMDEAARRFHLTGAPDGIILSLDADTLVEPDYLVKSLAHFRSDPSIEGCSIYFEHPLEGEEFSKDVYHAVSLYELHLRYYVRAVSSTGYPYACHTVGSCFGVKAKAYCRYGGMSRRKGGEDFYFIQKVAQNGHFNTCTSTRIIPSPRPSDRVPFGTGPAISNMLANPSREFLTYNTESFKMLSELFSIIRKVPEAVFFSRHLKRLHPVLREYLISINFRDALTEIHSNSSSAQSFMKRFWRYFNMFRILKFLHHARENGIPDLPVVPTAQKFLEDKGFILKGKPGVQDVLNVYRQLDRGAISDPHR